MDIRNSTTIEKPASEVWDIIGPRFAHVAEWVSAIPVSTAAGEAELPGAPCAGRVCTVGSAGFGEITERLTRYEEGARTLSYELTLGMPRFVTGASNTWRVEELPAGRCRFAMDATLRVRWWGLPMLPLLGGYLRRVGRQTCRDLKTFSETGQVSRRKSRRSGRARAPETVGGGD